MTTRRQLGVDVAYWILRHGGSDLTQTDIHMVIEGFLEELAAELIRGKRVDLRGFGTFRVVERAARVGRDMKNGGKAPVIIPATRKPIWTPDEDFAKKIAAQTPPATKATGPAPED